MSDKVVPAAFIGHGSPMNALERNRFTDTWRAFGKSLERPRAVVVVSAHWYINATAVTAMARPRTIHDFYGFPDELFAFDYAAPGAPDVAVELVEAVKPRWIGLDHDSWGIDHGAWSVLAHVFPEADVPIVQLSINGLEPLEYHFDIGQRLAPLRETGVLVLSSGNIVHNLRRIDWSQPDGGFDWAHRFDEAVRRLMTERPDEILSVVEHDDFALSVPTPDHFIPLVYLAGLASVEGRKPDMLIEGCTYGSLSMTSYTVDKVVPDLHERATAAAIPDPDLVPTAETNI